MKRLLAVPVILALFGTVSMAASRTWKSSNGRFTTEAELLDFENGMVQLKKDDGKIIHVPLSSLSVEDREYVKGRFPGIEEEQVRPGANYREWKSKSGKFSTLAEFLGFADGSVRLRKSDGSEITVAKNRLGEDDQRWVTDELHRLQKEEDEDAQATEQPAEEDVAGQIAAQHIPMKLLRIELPTGPSRDKSGSRRESLLQFIQPQLFHRQLDKNADVQETKFHNVVKKEPKYALATPFRGIANLCSREYGFALDTVEPETTGYNKLYFDFNGNGDLTDDKPVMTTKVNKGTGIAQSQFPRVNLTIDADGQSLDYAFLLSTIRHEAAANSYATVSLYSAVVREGHVTQGAKRTKLLLLDRNSNGRFDDAASLQSAETLVQGDVLLINPDAKRLSSADVMESDQSFVGRTVCIGKDFYRMEISPTGSNLKLTPIQPVMGRVACSSFSYRAVLINPDYGIVAVKGVKDRDVTLPEGEWKVTSYTLRAAGDSRATIAARFAQPPLAVTVSKAKTANLLFGSPFRAIVTSRRINPDNVYLSLAIVGAADEQCTSCTVKKSRPPSPRFVVKDNDDKIVHEGKFEYG